MWVCARDRCVLWRHWRSIDASQLQLGRLSWVRASQNYLRVLASCLPLAAIKTQKTLTSCDETSWQILARSERNATLSNNWQPNIDSTNLDRTNRSRTWDKLRMSVSNQQNKLVLLWRGSCHSQSKFKARFCCVSFTEVFKPLLSPLLSVFETHTFNLSLDLIRVVFGFYQQTTNRLAFCDLF